MTTSNVTVRSYGTDGDFTRPPRPPGSLLGAICLVLSPLMLGAALTGATWDVVRETGAPNPAAIAQWNADRIALSYNLGSLGNVVSIGAIIALAVVVGRKHPRTAVWGAALSLLGVCSTLINSVSNLPYFATRGITPQESFDSWGQAYMAQTAQIAVYWFFPFFIIGGLVLAIGLWRSRQVPPWAAACVLVGMFIPVAAIVEIGVVAIPFTVTKVIGSVVVALALLRDPNMARTHRTAL